MLNFCHKVIPLFCFPPQVQGMLSQMDPALVAYCDKIAAQGGPLNLPDDMGGSTFPSNPVVQLGTVTRASARLRNVQPEVNLDQSYEALKRPKKNADAAHAGIKTFGVVTFLLLWRNEITDKTADILPGCNKVSVNASNLSVRTKPLT